MYVIMVLVSKIYVYVRVHLFPCILYTNFKVSQLQLLGNFNTHGYFMKSSSRSKQGDF